MSFARQIDEQRYREQTERQASMPGVISCAANLALQGWEG